MGIQFRPRATGRIDFSATLGLSSISGYSRKRVGFVHSVNAYLQTLPSALEGNAMDWINPKQSQRAADREGPPYTGFGFLPNWRWCQYG